MKNYKLKILLLFTLFFSADLFAQSSVNSASGEATGTGGSASYSVGEVLYSYNSSSTGSESQGFQETSIGDMITTSISNSILSIEGFYVAPNPVVDIMTVIGLKDNESYTIVNSDIKNCSARSINISDLPKGIYYIITSKNRRISFYKE